MGCSAVVTGAAGGIGRAVALALSAEGASLVLVDRDAAVADVADEIVALGREAAYEHGDVTDETVLEAAMARAADRFGGVDVVVCCAGISGPFGAAIDDIAARDVTQVLAVNVLGPFLAVKHAAKHLRRSTRASVVLLASDSSFVAAPGMVPYNASKGAVLQLTRALSVDLTGDGIRVNCVCPSVVDTAMARADLGFAMTDEMAFADAGYPVQSAGDVARHVLYLAAPASYPINGQSVVSDFGYLARSSFPA